MKKYVPLLKNTSLFFDMQEDEIVQLLKCISAGVAQYQKGDYLIRSGENIRKIGLLVSGGLTVFQEDFWGNGNLIHQIKPGQLFAEAFAVVENAEMTVSVAADVNSEVLWLAARRIMNACDSACSAHLKLLQNILSDFAVKNLTMNEKITHMSKRTTRQKLLSYLSEQARKCSATAFDIPFNRQQLADYLSVDRSAMSAELSKLQSEGLIIYKKNHFVLLNVDES